MLREQGGRSAVCDKYGITQSEHRTICTEGGGGGRPNIAANLSEHQKPCFLGLLDNFSVRLSKDRNLFSSRLRCSRGFSFWKEIVILNRQRLLARTAVSSLWPTRRLHEHIGMYVSHSIGEDFGHGIQLSLPLPLSHDFPIVKLLEHRRQRDVCTQVWIPERMEFPVRNHKFLRHQQK